VLDGRFAGLGALSPLRWPRVAEHDRRGYGDRSDCENHFNHVLCSP
jgi:hypothetical protein